VGFVTEWQENGGMGGRLGDRMAENVGIADMLKKSVFLCVL